MAFVRLAAPGCQRRIAAAVVSFSPAMDLGLCKQLSCGIVIVNDAAELLLCHVTGHDHWDLPKGGISPGETPLQAALRETREETGLVIAADVLLDLGRLDYRPRKDLHLFATLMPRVDPSRLACESHFTDHRGGCRLPEMDGFDWFAFDQVGALCTPRLASVLCGRLDLDALLERLREMVAPPVVA
jgi:8-oxo-dGTP pyrophosphatase MutT (NUDIX family)